VIALLLKEALIFETIDWYGELLIPEVSQRLPSILAEVHGL
jgi:hypothetical protein